MFFPKILLKVMFLSVILNACGTAEATTLLKVGEAFPADLIIGQSNGGESLRAAQFNGKVTVVNFWATWCEACKVELVEMREQFAALREKKKDDFRFFMVSLDKDVDAAHRWVKDHLGANAGFDPAKSLYFDSDFKAAEALGVDAFPMTFVIGRDGKIVYVQREFSKGKGQTENLVRLIEPL